MDRVGPLPYVDVEDVVDGLLSLSSLFGGDDGGLLDMLVSTSAIDMCVFEMCVWRCFV